MSVAGLGPLGASGNQELLLGPGDILSVAVIGMPEVARDVPVETDGTAWFPLIGPIDAVGQTLSKVRETVADAYVGLIVSSSGQGMAPAFVSANQVYVAVKEYRPDYVIGDRTDPGTVPFRPGLTARQALALAGTSAVRTEGGGVQDRINATMVDLSRTFARIWSLKRQLAIDTEEDYRKILVDDSTAVREVATAAQSLVAAQARERAAEKARIKSAIARANDRLAALLSQKTSEADGRRIDDQIVTEVRELFERGSPLAPASRLAEVRRSALASASRILELEVAAENVRNEVADLEARQADLETGVQSDIWSALADALTEAARKQAELAVLRTAPSGLMGVDFTISILRSGVEVRSAEEKDDPELAPGDVVEVRRARQEMTPVAGLSSPEE